ncbi:MAG: hypothetical protein AABW73_04730 [Nanoarchaeota archaeon]
MSKESLNKQIFFGAMGLFFSFPTAEETFLQYIAPTVLRDSTNPSIPILIGLIGILIAISSISWLIIIAKQIKKMWGILTDKHLRNMVFAFFLGAVVGMALKVIVF